METAKVSDEDILRGLHAHPQIRARVAGLLAMAQSTNTGLRRADDAEDWLIEEIRALGQETLQSWAQSQVSQTEEDVRHSGRAHREGKKNCTGTPPLAT